MRQCLKPSASTLRLRARICIRVGALCELAHSVGRRSSSRWMTARLLFEGPSSQRFAGNSVIRSSVVSARCGRASGAAPRGGSARQEEGARRRHRFGASGERSTSRPDAFHCVGGGVPGSPGAMSPVSGEIAGLSYFPHAPRARGRGDLTLAIPGRRRGDTKVSAATLGARLRTQRVGRLTLPGGRRDRDAGERRLVQRPGACTPNSGTSRPPSTRPTTTVRPRRQRRREREHEARPHPGASAGVFRSALYGSSPWCCLRCAGCHDERGRPWRRRP